MFGSLTNQYKRQMHYIDNSFYFNVDFGRHILNMAFSHTILQQVLSLSLSVFHTHSLTYSLVWYNIIDGFLLNLLSLRDEG